jgi:hypothetical protein
LPRGIFAVRIVLPERRERPQLRVVPAAGEDPMGDLWATMLPAAIAVAVSPTGIIEMILVLFSARARVNAIVFLASVMVSVFLLPLLGASILGATVASDTAATSPSAAKAWVLIGLGVLLVFSPSATSRSGPTLDVSPLLVAAPNGRGKRMASVISAR